MAGAGFEDADELLSDVEGEDVVPITVNNPVLPEDISVKYRELVAKLDRERQARQDAENTKSELQVSFGRLRALAHEAIRKREECARQRDEALRDKEVALRSNEKVLDDLIEADRVKAEALNQKDEFRKQLDEAVKERDNLRLEIGNSTHMLVTGMDKISGKVSILKSFTANGLPRSQKYTGLAAVAYGVIKRTNEIVEELVRQIDATAKARNETRDQMEQRNYEIAIEVSQLEATISGLREEVASKTSAAEKLERAVIGKDDKIHQIEQLMADKLDKVQNEALALRNLANQYDEKLRNLKSKMESQKPLLFEQLNFVSRVHGRFHDIINTVDANNYELSESLFLPKETDVEENVRASLAGMESIYELTWIVAEKTRDLVYEKNREIKNLNETVNQSIKEKDQVGSLLRSALSKSKRTSLNSAPKTSKLFQVAENGLREAGIDFKFYKFLGDGKNTAGVDNLTAVETEEDEIYSLAGALEDVVKTSQLEIFELQHAVDELRAELSLLKQRIESQDKELNLRMHHIKELEEKERLANESVEGLMLDIVAAEEEISRWKVAAEQEAAAGRAVEQEFVAQLRALKQELEEAKQSMLELENKIKFKEETATAAMAARDAAEKSLRLADLRSSRMRDRVEELTRQLEELENKADSRNHSRSRYVCWPWQWPGLDFVGIPRSDTQQQTSNEMELSEPLL